MSTEADIEQLAHVQILKCLLYKEDQNGRKALEYGLLDPKLGATHRNELCETCGLDYQSCIGHWGYFDLPVPVYHVGYLWHIVKILQCICKVCRFPVTFISRIVLAFLFLLRLDRSI